jgi:hypothetical protein
MDGAIFLKSPVPALPAGTEGFALDPRSYGIACGGSDPLCSTAYSELWGQLGPGAVKKLRAKYGIDGQLALVGFSAAHGFLNPLLASDEDRAGVSAVFLLDAVFGGGKSGYVAAAKDAAAGRMTLVSVTSDKGSADALTNGDYAWRQHVLGPAGLDMPPAEPAAPMPAPAGGVFRSGDLWYYRFPDAQLPHWRMGEILKPVLAAHLWKSPGARRPRWWAYGAAAVAVAAGALVYWRRS